MKYQANLLIPSIVALLLAAGFAVTAHAQANPAASSSEAATGSSQTAPETRAASSSAREAAQARQADNRAALALRAQERITNLAANISNRLEAVVDRFTNIMDRIDSRMKKLEGAGVDTAAAATELQLAREQTEQAANSLSDMDTVIANVVGAKTPAAAWSVAREQFVAARDALKSAQEHLRLTIAELKTAVASTSTTGVSDAVRADQSLERGSTTPPLRAGANTATTTITQ